MRSCSIRQANMNKENRTATFEEPTVRITRARAKGLATSGGLPPSRPSIRQDQKPILQQNAKRSASDENKSTLSVTARLQHKKRAVLKDVTNILCDNSHATKVQSVKNANQSTGKKSAKVAPAIFLESSQVQEDADAKIAEEISILETEESQQNVLPVNLKDVTNGQNTSINIRDFCVASMILAKKTSSKRTRQKSPFKEEGKSFEKLEASNDLQIPDIDSNHKDPLMCSLYAPDIYGNFHVMEFDRRPSFIYMEMLQGEITPNMRGILIDWLVEVSDKYCMVPDTLYLTVNLIDRFLSQNHIEKQRLQLLGVTCMLLASKYEEICAPRVEEFCIITDNTYTREEVLKMESQVLNFLGFQLSVPTTKKFLRRSIQVAQVSCKVPCVELEFLANYLAELTLVEYSFLKFLPSVIAASAVFLARWTLNQSDHPWNPTLEHYTSYMISDLKGAVLALQELQLNTKGCSLNAVREKYSLPKFKCVANLSSPKPVESVF
ncbi:Cyclin-A2-2 like [Actinidia chinensis var. chinensis]|uniref:Cyclin-A2-2 like n=1 Tax=Actinidia chinensis var. chinensis TaxID=1590841 RepID=A0A2R6Q2Q7_ACTCC|nr:Cyclin-A2-2 like [Actinidia chinensis var. chinensis]